MPDAPAPGFEPGHKPQKINQLRIRAEHDFIFFGRSFGNSLLKNAPGSEISWFFNDGDCVLKGQTILRIPHDKRGAEDSPYLQSLCYLSGVATFVRCYVENAGACPVIGSHSKESPFPDWEKKAVLAGGGVTFPYSLCSSEKSLNAVLKKNTARAVALDVSGFPDSQWTDRLQDIPKDIKKGIYGPFLPGDLIPFLQYPLDFISSSFLQGGFPSVRIHVDKE